MIFVIGIIFCFFRSNLSEHYFYSENVKSQNVTKKLNLKVKIPALCQVLWSNSCLSLFSFISVWHRRNFVPHNVQDRPAGWSPTKSFEDFATLYELPLDFNIWLPAQQRGFAL